MTSSTTPASSFGSPFGVCAHLASNEMLAALFAAGIRWFRLDMNWSEIEQTPGRRNWEPVERNVNEITRLGGCVLGSTAYLPPWQSVDGKSTGAPKDVPAWHAFLQELVQRTPTMHVLGIGNEPNLKQFYTGSRVAYPRLLRTSLEAVKKVAPSLLTAGPDLSSSPSGGDILKDWLLPILRECPPALMNVLTHHQYDGHDTVPGRMHELDKLKSFLVQQHDSRPVWLTEIGWGRSDQAVENLGPTFAGVRARSAWLQKLFWYDSHGAEFGLMQTQSGAARPALAAYSEAVRSWA